MDVLAICKGGVQVFRYSAPPPVDQSGASVSGSSPPVLAPTTIVKIKQWAGVECGQWTPTGKKFAVGKESSVILYDADSFEEESKFTASAPVKHLAFSPCATYLLSCSRSRPQDEPVAQLWDIESGKELYTKTLRAFSRQWPMLSWSGTGSLAFLMENQSVSVFDSLHRNFATLLCSIPVENPLKIVPSPENGSDCFLSVFSMTAARKDAEADAKLSVYDLSSIQEKVHQNILGSSAAQCTADDYPTVYRRSLGPATDVTMMWNFEASALLILSLFEVDKTHKYYEGSSCLTFIRMPRDVKLPPTDTAPSALSPHRSTNANSTKKIDVPTNKPSGQKVVFCDVIEPKNGPVHDVRWSPTSNEFLVSSGPMPPNIAMYNGRTGKIELSLGNSRRNTLRFSPSGRFCALGGFGNLPGDLDIWDTKEKARICSTEARCTVELEWAPDGRHLLGSTTNPRLRVDNCIKIYHYSGIVRARVNFDTLYSVKWRPTDASMYPDLPPTPGRCAPSSTKPLKTSLYRPPGSTGELAAKLRAERETEQQQRAIHVKFAPKAKSKPEEKLPPGYAPVAKAKTKKK